MKGAEHGLTAFTTSQHEHHRKMDIGIGSGSSGHRYLPRPPIRIEIAHLDGGAFSSSDMIYLSWRL